MIFPIINTAGKVIASEEERWDGEAMPKYLNSPENRVFQKKNNLYALNLTRQDIGRAKSAIIVEGYMDGDFSLSERRKKRDGFFGNSSD